MYLPLILPQTLWQIYQDPLDTVTGWLNGAAFFSWNLPFWNPPTPALIWTPPPRLAIPALSHFPLHWSPLVTSFLLDLLCFTLLLWWRYSFRNFSWKPTRAVAHLNMSLFVLHIWPDTEFSDGNTLPQCILGSGVSIEKSDVLPISSCVCDPFFFKPFSESVYLHSLSLVFWNFRVIYLGVHLFFHSVCLTFW